MVFEMIIQCLKLLLESVPVTNLNPYPEKKFDGSEFALVYHRKLKTHL
jgi:hypothetical protein